MATNNNKQSKGSTQLSVRTKNKKRRQQDRATSKHAQLRCNNAEQKNEQTSRTNAPLLLAAHSTRVHRTVREFCLWRSKTWLRCCAARTKHIHLRTKRPRKSAADTNAGTIKYERLWHTQNEHTDTHTVFARSRMGASALLLIMRVICAFSCLPAHKRHNQQDANTPECVRPFQNPNPQEMRDKHKQVLHFNGNPQKQEQLQRGQLFHAKNHCQSKATTLNDATVERVGAREG